MNWEAVGAIGESLGSIAVLATLVYLALQVRGARREVQRSISQNRREVFRNLQHNRVNNERLNALTLRASAGLGADAVHHPFISAIVERTGLTEEEASTILWDQWAWWSYRAQVIPYVDELAPGERIEFDNGTLVYGVHPVYRLWYETMRESLDPQCVKYVDRVMEKSARSG